MKNNISQTPIGKELEELKKKLNKRVQRKTSRLVEFLELVAAILTASVLYDVGKYLFLELLK